MPSRAEFVHLHLHSEYSLLDGLSSVEELAERARQLRMPAMALTDHGALYGAIDFYSACKERRVKPIVGVEAYVAPRARAGRDAQKDRQYSHLVLLAKDHGGYRNLLKLVTAAHLDGYFYKPRIDRELLTQHRKGLIALSGCFSGEPSAAVLAGEPDKAREAAAWYRELFGPDYFLEIQDHSLEEDQKVNRGLIELSKELGIPLVATNDAHYTLKEQAPAQDLLLCAQMNTSLDDPKRMRMEPEEFYVKSAEEMAALFGETPEAVRNTLEIAERCDLKLSFDRLNFPELSHLVPDGESLDEYLARLCWEALPKRYPQASAEHEERLRYELEVVQKTGFAAYILFVWDYVAWARQQGIACGPRGSAAGSIILYLLGVSDVDPIEYGLTFERFLNPERAQMPDIDMDFADDSRERVIDYVVQRYGRDHVAQIATFGRLLARAAIRDVGRTLAYPLSLTDQVAKLIPTIPVGMTIDQALKESRELEMLYETNPAVKRLIEAARTVEGVARNVSTHAAGVVVAGDPLVEHVPLQRASKHVLSGANGNDTALMAQYPMKPLEKIGLLKMDFLGLANLTMLERAVEYVEATRGLKLDLSNLPPDDPDTFQKLSEGETHSVFQLEGSGMTRYIKELKPTTILHLIAMISLYRPGPMAHLPTYIRRKAGKEPVSYPEPSLQDLLEETYGIIVYQDQVLQIVQRVAGYSLGQADILRRAMGKKIKEEMKSERQNFLNGARANGYSDKIASKLWEYIEPFAGYAFNKCVVGTTSLVDAVSGERTTVQSLFARPRPYTVHALGPDGKLRARRVVGVTSNGRKPVFELRTVQGHRITATGNHPFRTLDGWTVLANLKPGDRIAAPRSLGVEGGDAWPHHQLVVLAGLLSEGNTCHPSSLYFYNNDPALIGDFVQAAASFPDTVARVTARENGRKVVCLNTGRDARFRAGARPWNAGGHPGRATVAQAECPPVPARSGVFDWAVHLGLVGRRAAEKRIPEAVFRLRDADLEVLLGRLWSGDGFLANATNTVPYYATSSEQLAYDVQTLLLRLGIVSGIHRKSFRYRGQERAGWTVHLVGNDSVEAFARRILPHTVGRDVAVERLLLHLETTARGMTAVDTIPDGVRRWVDEERRKAGLTWRQLEERSGVAMREFAGNGSAVKRGFRRLTIERLAAFFDSVRLTAIATSDLFWDRVASIEPRGEQPTYDLAVEGDHNFVADGLVVHNSHAACYALIAYQTAYLKAHFPPEWMAAVLTTDADNTDRVVSAIGECRRLGIPLLRPDVNRSQSHFAVERLSAVSSQLSVEPTADSRPASGGTALGIRYGLAAVKNLGTGAVESIIAEREARGRFKSLDDFCHRVDLRALNKRCIESLVKCGAMDDFGPRERLLKGIDQCMAAGQQAQRAADLGQTSLFDVMGSDSSAAGESVLATLLPVAQPLSQRKRLEWEKETLGLYFSDHPFQEAARWLQERKLTASAQLSPESKNEQVKIAGVVSSLKRITTKRKDLMAVATLEDLHGSVEVTVFPKTYAQTEEIWQQDAVLIVSGRVDLRNERVQVICESAEAFEVPEGEPPAAGDRRPAAGEMTAGNGAAASNDTGANGSQSDRANGAAATPVAADEPSNGAAERAEPAAGNSSGSVPPPPSANGPLPAVNDASPAAVRRPGGAPAGVAGERPPILLSLRVARSGNPPQDIQTLDQLHALLPQEGPDAYEIYLSAGSRSVRISNPEARTCYSPDLQRQLEELLGPSAVQVRAADEQAATPEAKAPE